MSAPECPSGYGTGFGIIGAAAVPHAPQLLSAPASESREQIARVKQSLFTVGESLRALSPDLVIVISNEHGDQFILDSVPAFTLHCGNDAQGEDDHAGRWTLDGAAGYALTRALQEEGFDPAFTLSANLGTSFTIPFAFMGWNQDTPMLALFVNAYVPPQPSPERCFAFGKALHRALQRLGRRAVMIASGGLSHYPGTARYADPGPDLEFDRRIFAALTEGNLRRLLASSPLELDRTGNVEARSWLMLAGALGEVKPDYAAFEENWHHTYAVLGWSQLAANHERGTLWYAPTPPHRVELSKALQRLRVDASACRAFLENSAAFCCAYPLTDEEATALQTLNESLLRDALGIHPLLVAGALRHLNIIRKSAASAPS